MDDLKTTRRLVRREKLKNHNFWFGLLRLVFIWILLGGLMYIMIYPLLFVVSTSFKSYSDMINPTTVWLPKRPTFSEYSRAFEAMDFVNSFKNTLVVAGIPPILQIISCSLVGYGLARFEFPEKKIVFGLIVFTLVVPQQVVSLPQFILFRDLHMINTFMPIMIPSALGMGLKGGLFIFIFRQFFRGLPKELEEAAYIDGSGFSRTFLTIMVPNAVPAAVTVFLFSFVWHYNDTFLISMFTTGKTLTTLTMRVINIMGYLLKPGVTMRDPVQYIPAKYAGVCMTIMPVLLVYLAGQRFFVQGVERSGIVG